MPDALPEQDLDRGLAAAAACNRHRRPRRRSRGSRWSGQSLSSGQLAKVCAFTDLDGTQPDCRRYLVEVVEREGAPADDTGYR